MLYLVTFTDILTPQFIVDGNDAEDAIKQAITANMQYTTINAVEIINNGDGEGIKIENLVSRMQDKSQYKAEEIDLNVLNDLLQRDEEDYKGIYENTIVLENIGY